LFSNSKLIPKIGQAYINHIRGKFVKSLSYVHSCLNSASNTSGDAQTAMQCLLAKAHNLLLLGFRDEAAHNLRLFEAFHMKNLLKRHPSLDLTFYGKWVSCSRINELVSCLRINEWVNCSRINELVSSRINELVSC